MPDWSRSKGPQWLLPAKAAAVADTKIRLSLTQLRHAASKDDAAQQGVRSPRGTLWNMARSASNLTPP
jgi:hypothetical protein